MAHPQNRFLEPLRGSFSKFTTINPAYFVWQSSPREKAFECIKVQASYAYVLWTRDRRVAYFRRGPIFMQGSLLSWGFDAISKLQNVFVHPFNTKICYLSTFTKTYYVYLTKHMDPFSTRGLSATLFFA